jgi:phosphatidylserine/phosphatidylglycerophosphate/cardiolipin synthase-like enzyme
MQAELLQDDWKDALADLFRHTSDNLLISSPFVTRRGVDHLVENLSESVREKGNVQVLVNLSPQNVINGATEPESLQYLSSEVSDVTTYHLPRLHAKVYVADLTRAIVTSGNLTSGGLDKNYEYGVSTSDGGAVSAIKNDIEAYSELGARVSSDELKTYVNAAKKVKSTFREQQQSAKQAARQEFEDALVEANDELIRIRLRGESTNETFAKTILYLLRKKGPMATSELHPHVQQIHPDLCDDSVDRVIEGENYGKRWKHRVRAAQSTLKQRGKIELEDDTWKLAE